MHEDLSGGLDDGGGAAAAAIVEDVDQALALADVAAILAHALHFYYRFICHILCK